MRWYLLAALVLLCTPAVLGAEEIQVEIAESGKITSYLNTYWVVQVNGTGTVTNPSDKDIFDVRLFFDILNLDIIDRGGDGEFDQNSLYFNRLPAGEERTFNYQIIGITTEPPTLKGKGVLYTGLAKRTTRIYSDVFGEIQKAPLEKEEVTGRPGRLVSVTLENPTSFQFTIESMRVLKTPELDPNEVLREWRVVNESTPRVLDPDGFFVHDILDRNSSKGAVYWLQSEVFISEVNFVDNNTLKRYSEENLTVPVEALNFTNVTDNESVDRVTSRYVLRKKVSDSIAVPGEPLTVSLYLYNLGDTLDEYTLSDELPAGFTTASDLEWSGEVPRRNSVVHEYTTVLNETGTVGFDTFPRARAEIGGQTVFSREQSFVREFVPDNKVYVQKRVRFRDDDRVAVELEVKNLGRGSLSGATLKEFLDENAPFSEITESPQSKGVWEVPVVRSGESWKVSYVTEQGADLSRLPSLYGVESHTVLRSIVLENVVNEAWEFVRTKWMEIFGVLVVLVAPVVFFVGQRRDWFTKR